ncbi:unnamed protein product [Cyclocybe aegerita]|uniref:Uncharacterized protein n=1 Tax=Cyclocybe aegerita TaxID=1973307 RepID=A0A8S0X688_CYCAE|nr:unnamed protein product [Cyclocybe aegerita]
MGCDAGRFESISVPEEDGGEGTPPRAGTYEAVAIEEKLAPYASQIASRDSYTNYLRSRLASTSSELDEANEREIAVSRCLDVVAKNWQDETPERQLKRAASTKYLHELELAKRCIAELQGEVSSANEAIAAQMRDFGE